MPVLRRAHLLTPQEFVAADGDELFTDSAKVAAVFGKRQTHVMRSIRELLDQMPSEDHATTFGLMVVDVAIGSGASRRYPAYRLNFEQVTYFDEKSESRVMFRLRKIAPTVIGQLFAHLYRLLKI